MGHHQLYDSPRTPGFKRVVSLLGVGAGAPGAAGIGPGTLEEIAAATIDASESGLELAKSDEGLSFSIYLLAAIVNSARTTDVASTLASLGVMLEHPSTAHPDLAQAKTAATLNIFDLVGGFSEAFDLHVRATRTRTDISEMAHLAASESLTVLCGNRADTLYGTSPDRVQSALRELSTEKGFGTLAHEFFSRFSRRFLEYHLSRELSNHVGPKRRFKGIAEENAFVQEMDRHCRAATAVVKKFAGEWYGKHQFQKTLTLRKTKFFAAHAIDKVRDSLRFKEGRVEA
jgi:hypothetical protein